jgi:hypothetical protein
MENSKNYKLILSFKYSGKRTPRSLNLSLCNVYIVFPGSCLVVCSANGVFYNKKFFIRIFSFGVWYSRYIYVQF